MKRARRRNRAPDHVTRERFHIERGAQTHTPILHGEHVYLLVNENWNYAGRKAEGGLMCLDLNGEEKWRTKDDPYFGRGSPILAGDHLLIQDGFNGVLRVIRASPDGYQQIAEANVFDKGERGDDQNDEGPYHGANLPRVVGRIKKEGPGRQESRAGTCVPARRRLHPHGPSLARFPCRGVT